MKIPKPFGKKSDEKSKSTTVPVVTNQNKDKKTTNNVSNQTQNVKRVETQPHAVPYNTDVDYGAIQRTFFFKRLIDKKLTILLIENSSKVSKEKESLIKIVKSFVTEGLVSVINYGATVRQSEIVDVSAFDNITFLYDNNTGDMACLYDALVALQNLVSKKYMLIEENETERVRVNKIEVIGIGTCRDGCSKVSKEVGIDCFCKVADKTEVITKYFCLTEETFMDAAEIGFRSIGAILRNY